MGTFCSVVTDRGTDTHWQATSHFSQICQRTWKLNGNSWLFTEQYFPRLWTIPRFCMGKTALQPFLTSNRSNTVNFTSIFQYRTLLNMAQSLCSAYITAARGTCTVPFIRKIVRYCSTLALLRDITCKMSVRWRHRNNYKGRAVKARLQRARRTIYCPSCPWGQYTVLGPNGLV